MTFEKPVAPMAWSEAHVIKSATPGVVVVITKSAHARPDYSISVRFQSSPSGVVGLYRRVRWSLTGKTTKIERCSKDVEQVVHEAEEWVEARIQEDQTRVEAELAARAPISSPSARPKVNGAAVVAAATGGLHRLGKTAKKRLKEQAAKERARS